MSYSNSAIRCWLRKAFTNSGSGLSRFSGDIVRGSNVSVAVIAMGIRWFHGQVVMVSGEVKMGSRRFQWCLYWTEVAKVPFRGLRSFVHLNIPHFMKQRSLTFQEPIANTLKITLKWETFPLESFLCDSHFKGVSIALLSLQIHPQLLVALYLY